MPRRAGAGAGPPAQRIGGRKHRSHGRLGDDISGSDESDGDEVIGDDSMHDADDADDSGGEYGLLGADSGDADADVEMTEDATENQNDNSSADETSDDEAIVDIDEVRYGDTEGTADRTVRAGLDLDDVLGAASYEEVIFAEPPPEPRAFNDYHDDGPDVTGDSASIESAHDELHPEGSGVDTSELIVVHQNKHIESSKFEKALATFADLTGLSRSDWASLREVLQLIKDDRGNVHKDVAALPIELSTLRDRIRKRMPMMNMRQAEIPVNILNLPTVPASLKASERQMLESWKSKIAEAEAAAKASGKSRTGARNKIIQQAQKAEKDLPTATMKITFFDPPSVFKNFIASDLYRDAHHGPAMFVDEPTELFHSQSWASSIRTSSGIYPHVYINGEIGPVVFPSDFVYYRCIDVDCYCHSIPDDDENIVTIHIGRVIGFGYDQRSNSCTEAWKNDRTELALQIQEAFPLECERMPAVQLDPDQEFNELILTSALTYIPETSLYSHVSVYVDKYHGEDHEDPGWKPPAERRQRPQAARAFPKYYQPNHVPERTEDQWHMVRRIIHNNTVVPLCHTHPIRADLELAHYSREYFEQTWDVTKPDAKPVKSFPYICFIDGFGVYRNSYRTLMGIYITPAGLSSTERNRPGNIFPLALGPHASEFSDVLKALKTLKYLDGGQVMDVNDKSVIVCAFPLCFTGDMPQENENSGFKGPRAKKYCRFCIIQSGEVAIPPVPEVTADMVQRGRYHNQIIEMQSAMKELPNGSQQDRYGTQWGIATPEPPLAQIFPALDLILTRPMDAAHSEYQGLTTLMHFLLRDGILSKSGRAEYAIELRVWPFPLGVRRLMSPVHHLSSYKQSEHAVWSLVAPAMLRHWLRKEHIQPRFYDHASAMESDTDPVDLVVQTCVAITKSHTVLMGKKVSQEDRRNVFQIIHHARSMFTMLSTFAAASATSAWGSRRGSVAPQTPLRDAGENETIAGPSTPAGDNPPVSKQSAQYMSDTLRPNIHIGVHYPLLFEEYALPVNVNTLTGENLHRYFKTRVYETNYSNIEKILLMKANFQETIRLVLRGAFKVEDPELTEQILDLRQECPSLFDKVLSRTDRDQLEAGAGTGVAGSQDDFEMELYSSANANHLKPSAINRIPGKEIARLKHAANDDHHLPLRPELATPGFRRRIRLAFEKEYGKPTEYPSLFENRPIQWSRKFGYTDKILIDRFTFSCGNFVKFTRDGLQQFGRIDHVCVIDTGGESHIFVVLTLVRLTNRRDAILDLPIMEEVMGEVFVVGIPAIEAVRLYIVNIAGVGLIWVDWELYYL
ncbi:hypothetical protein G7054_g7828 [Neopestalotiopsis clavispora]|nr:hypothetical protein G7054_g7828 [Neopestalotiopsis clavispora]